MFLIAKTPERELKKTIRKLGRLDSKVGRKVLREAVFKEGSTTVKQLKRACPKGRTGQSRRSLAKKDIRNAKQGVYTSIAGMNWKKGSTAKQAASAIRKIGSINVSRGLSGRGKPPAVWWLDRGTKAHRIKAVNAKMLWWKIVKGDKDIQPWRSDIQVIHPGHKGTGFVSKTERRYRTSRIRNIRARIERGIRVEMSKP